MQHSQTTYQKCTQGKVWKYAANLQENTHAEVWFHTSAWVFSGKFAAYFQDILSLENLWMATSEYSLWFFIDLVSLNKRNETIEIEGKLRQNQLSLLRNIFHFARFYRNMQYKQVFKIINPLLKRLKIYPNAKTTTPRKNVLQYAKCSIDEYFLYKQVRVRFQLITSVLQNNCAEKLVKI